MLYSEMFSDSALRWPTGGARLSPAACAFVLGEFEALCLKYEKELERDYTEKHYVMMVERHLEGLRAIKADIEFGMTNKPESVK